MQKEYTYNKDLNRMLFLITFAGIIPLIIIFITYTSNPNFYLIRIIFDNTQNIPSVISSYNPVMTKVMDIYGKSAPLLAFIAFIMLFKHTRTHKITDRKKIITACILSPFLCIFYAYFFLWHNFELTTSGRPVRLMSENDLTLLIFYICLYYCSFFITYALCLQPVIAYKLWKER